MLVNIILRVPLGLSDLLLRDLVVGIARPAGARLLSAESLNDQAKLTFEAPDDFSAAAERDLHAALVAQLAEFDDPA